jgi:phosphatidylinositol glycan class N
LWPVAGSWLEIGQSISFFCITSLLLVWSAGICAAGEYLMASSFVVPPVQQGQVDVHLKAQ